ncbi:hypothetical protein ACIQVO_17860 [Streptomyces sp. NPDC101062]|uniref:hypothetical protein n=1 Tax=unclassified Streptomyces TaxID=2593676 RepID=UPI0038213A89
MIDKVTEKVAARSLVPESLFQRLTQRLVSNAALKPEQAERVMDQTLAYLATCASKGPGVPGLNMSRAVDAGWHTFLEYSQQYDEFFSYRRWPKVHHNPCDGWNGVTYPPAAQVLPLTVAAISAAGFRVEYDLWTAKTDCEGDTCGDDGNGGNELPSCEHSV